MKLLSMVLSLVILTACAGQTPAVVLTPEQQAQVNQQRFETACRITKNGISTATPIVLAYEVKIGQQGILAYKSFVLTINEACDGTLDFTKGVAVDQIVQKLFDLGGQITALVIKAQQN